jgi:hypothetical protein
MAELWTAIAIGRTVLHRSATSATSKKRLSQGFGGLTK